ncbi:MAG: TRAP transporter substrate-binding protein [Spirochaetaceae bacterium]|nr:TRAP transporter substrate-binding protein [Spirochaetaceae bacterium]
MKKFLFVLMALLVSVSLFAGGGKEEGAAAQKITIKVGDNWGASHPVAAALDKVFKTEIEKGIPGATVDIYHSGTLGNEADLWNGARNGTIEVAIVGTPFNQEWSQGNISDWPFLYRDVDHAKKVWSSPIADELNTSFHQRFPEVYMLAWGPNSARTFTSNKPLTKFEDFKGQKFRMPGNPIHVGIAEGVGASAQVIPLGELFSALETGVVDGQDNGMVTVISEAFYEVQKYVYETNHIIATLEIVVNAKFLDSLPASAQTVIKNAAKATMAAAWDNYIAELASERDFLKSKGVTVTACDAANQAKIQAAIKPLTDKLLAGQPPFAADIASWAPATIERIKNVK